MRQSEFYGCISPVVEPIEPLSDIGSVLFWNALFIYVLDLGVQVRLVADVGSHVFAEHPGGDIRRRGTID